MTIAADFAVSSPRRPTLVDALRLRLSAFEMIADSDWSSLQARIERPLHLASYADLTAERGQPNSVAVLLAGMACRYRLMPNGRRQITALLLPGDICSFSFLGAHQGAESIHALAPSQIGRIGVKALIDCCERHPAIMRAILSAASAQTSIAEEHVVSLAQRTAVERMAHLLCEIWLRLDIVGLVEPGLKFDFPLTQSEIGDTLGLSTVHVNRTIQALRHAGMIVMKQGMVVISDMNALQHMAGFDPGYLALRKKTTVLGLHQATA